MARCTKSPVSTFQCDRITSQPICFLDIVAKGVTIGHYTEREGVYKSVNQKANLFKGFYKGFITASNLNRTKKNSYFKFGFCIRK